MESKVNYPYIYFLLESNMVFVYRIISERIGFDR